MFELFNTWWSAIISFPTNHPTFVAWFASSVSALVLVRGAWNWLTAPLINVQLTKKAGSHAKTPLGELFQSEAMYFRLLVRNDGWRTLKDCHGVLIRVTRRASGKKREDFTSERHTLGWAHRESEKRDISGRGGSHHLDLATLLLRPAGQNELGVWQKGVPLTLTQFLAAFPGRARYTFHVRIEADNAPPRTVRAEFLFDPAKNDLTFVPLSTRRPFWQTWWWLRAKWSRWLHGC